MPEVPDKPSLEGLELKWDAAWQQQGTFRFDRTKPRADVYSIDTPPPTVSGSLHLGTVFGYVQVDSIARFHRMRGREVFYPMGWDDNGLPTERRVQNYYGVRCDPSLPYTPDLDVAENGEQTRLISRRNFLELCERLTAIDEQTFEDVWRRVGLSVDWTLTYATIDDKSRRVAQRAFLRNVARGEAYATEAPTMWDVDFQTAVAQAEFEERMTPGAYHRVAFPRADGVAPIEIETTRPELLPACVALVAHPGDERYGALFGTDVLTPLFGVRIPVVAHELADPEKGSGIAMICTFGDTTDVVWWRELDLPTRSVLRRDGRLRDDTPEWINGDGEAAWRELAGKTVTQARSRIAELLRDAGDLVGEPRPIEHEVKFFEKGDRPLEIVTSRQWYIRNGARDEQRRNELIDAGRALCWHPDFMRVRYEHWVEGLNGDWLISRQRYFGVPFPAWYPVDEHGEPRWDAPILADEAALPVDPQSDTPPGYDADRRGVPGGFVGDPDVMDTWATSSLTPQIVCGWEEDTDLFGRTFPMDLRPQGPEIIRTWLFSTVLRSQLEHDVLPWSNATINGWILDPDRKKMSKSKGNVVTPNALIDEHGSDGLRYWACGAAPGTDTAADPGQMRIGRRLAVKLLNASKFALGLGADRGTAAEVTEPLDRAMLAQLAHVVTEATVAFENYQYQRALERTEAFFWRFCDDYVELVKTRAYDNGPASQSARAALSSRAGDVAAHVRAVPAVRDRGSVVVVAGRLGTSRIVARQRRARGRGGRRGFRRARRHCERAHRGAQGEVDRETRYAHAGGAARRRRRCRASRVLARRRIRPARRGRGPDPGAPRVADRRSHGGARPGRITVWTLPVLQAHTTVQTGGPPVPCAGMREIADAPFPGWSPPAYRVDPDGKVVGAQPGAHHNWGRFGDLDQLGTANHCTADRIVTAARLIRTGKRFTLGLPIGPPTPGGYRSEPLHFYGMAAGDGVLSASRAGGDFQTSDDYIVMALQASTQLDGFGHVGAEHTLYNGYWAGLVNATNGARRLGVHHIARHGIVGRAVVLDIARHLGVEHVEPGFAIGPEELDGAARAQNVSVTPGDIVLVHTGHLGWKTTLARNSVEALSRHEPGMGIAAIPWLREHDVAMVATDTAACQVVPAEAGDPFLTWHVAALRDLGLLIGELFDLDELAADCAADGVYEGFFVALPMPVVGASGSPLNPLVIK